MRTQSGTAEREAGYTLLELLVVIVILGLLIGLVGPALIDRLGSAKASIAEQSIKQIGGALDIYRLDTGTYPTTDEGLAVLMSAPDGVEGWNGPYLKQSKVPADPWNHPYGYRAPSSRPRLGYDLCSGGPRHVTPAPGTEGAICNQ